VRQFDNPLHRVLASARAVPIVLDSSGPAYRRSMRRLFDDVRAIADVHERWEALGHLALALLPVAPECLDHYLSRRVSWHAPVFGPLSANLRVQLVRTTGCGCGRECGLADPNWGLSQPQRAVGLSEELVWSSVHVPDWRSRICR
jgi:hypothetical protein